MKIGIYLGYGPQVNMRKEGLGRTLADNIQGFLDNDHSITVACPKWFEKSFKELMTDRNIPAEKIAYLTTSHGTPPLWKLYLWLTGKHRRHRLKAMLQGLMSSLSIWVGERLSKSKTFSSFALWILFFVLCGLVLLIPALIVGVLLAIVYVLRRLIGKLADKFGDVKRLLLPPDYFEKMFQNMLDSANEELVGTINSTPEKQDVWYVPTLFWPQVSQIRNAPIVLNAPDLVSEEFPIGFSAVDSAVNGVTNCRKTLTGCEYFITYCDYLRRSLIVNEFGKPANHCIAIPHPRADLYKYIRLDERMGQRFRTEKDFSDEYARAQLDSLVPGLRDVRYIFYCSQVRPSKNILNLVKAYEYLVRKRFNNVKLVLTCKASADKQLEAYIKDHRLGSDIIFCYNVSSAKLAALYYCAELVVNPTLYEGGFPFTFGEGMSVGTPSVMSRIPQVQDVLEPAGLDEVMFDPYDWRDMADKIEYWLAHKEELYQKELPLYEELAKRTPEVVAKEYAEAFQTFIEMDRAEKAGLYSQSAG